MYFFFLFVTNEGARKPTWPTVGMLETRALLHHWRKRSAHTTLGERYTMSSTDPITENVIAPLAQFAKDSYRLYNKCQKPDRKEFSKIAIATSVGFLLMGFLGFFVKLIHIPINQIIVGS